MSVVIVCAVALLASGLTFFSGFGLGTLLLPAFALFYPIEQAITLTAIVHFLNGLFKLALVGRRAHFGIVVAFGLPAVAAALAGAWALSWLSEINPLVRYSLMGREFLVLPAKLTVGLLLLLFSLAEMLPRVRDVSFPPRYFMLGGLVSGFFGGLSGMQGALRSAFLARAGLSKDAFIATGVVIACLIDVSRLGVYAHTISTERANLDLGLLGAAVLSAFAGAMIGNRYLKKLTMKSIQRVVAAMLLCVAVGLMTGLL